MAQEIIGVGVQVNAGAVGDLRKQLRDATKEVNAMRDAFGETSAEAVNAAKRAAELKEKIADTKDMVNAFHPEAKFNALAGALQGVVGGFSAVQGVMALFGTESEKVQETLLKVQAAMALSQGINSILSAKDAFMNLGLVIKSTAAFQAIYAASTRLATIVTAAFGVSVEATSVSFKVLRGAIISTGIGALVVLIGYAVNKIIEWTEATDDATESQKDLTNALKEQYDQIKKTADYEYKTAVAQAKLRGATEQEMYDLREKKRQDDLAKNEAYYKGLQVQQAGFLSEAQKQEQQDKINDIKLARLEDQAGMADSARKKEEKGTKEHKEKIKEISHDFYVDDLQMQIDSDSTKQIQQEGANQIESQKESESAENTKQLNQEKYEAIWKLGRENYEMMEYLRKLDEQRQTEAVFKTAELLDTASELAGRATAAGKALAIASTVISTYKSAQLAYESAFNPPTYASPVLGAVSAAAAIASGLVRLRQIMAVQVPGGGGGSAPSIGGAAGGSAPIAPQTVVQTTALDQKTLNQMGNSMVKAYVVESDLTGSQERMKRITNSAKIE